MEQKWKEVEGESSFWNGKEAMIAAGDSIFGIYKGKQDGVGMNNSTVYLLDNAGKETKVWGSTVLDEKMAGIATGQMIKIEFTGLSTPKAGRKAAKLYKVYQSEA